MFCTGIPILTIIAMVISSDFSHNYFRLTSTLHIGLINSCFFDSTEGFIPNQSPSHLFSPPRYKSSIGRMATSIIPYAVIIHLGVSIWSLGNL